MRGLHRMLIANGLLAESAVLVNIDYWIILSAKVREKKSAFDQAIRDLGFRLHPTQSIECIGFLFV